MCDTQSVDESLGQERQGSGVREDCMKQQDIQEYKFKNSRNYGLTMTLISRMEWLYYMGNVIQSELNEDDCLAIAKAYLVMKEELNKVSKIIQYKYANRFNKSKHFMEWVYEVKHDGQPISDSQSLDSKPLA